MLKALVTKWYDDLIIRNNIISNNLLNKLYYYLCGKSALLKDPLLLKYILNLMNKLYKKLLLTFKKLGIVIVYGNYNKIIINTNKNNFNDAKEYLDFIISVIHSNEIFTNLEVSNLLT